MEENKDISFLVEKVKEKREISNLADKSIYDSVSKYITKKKINLKNLSSRDVRLIVKEIRSELRLISGRFQANSKNRQKLMDSDNISKILESHSSTKERISFYPELKKLIKSLRAKSILDIGCGLNPIALASQNLTYYACDVNESELSLIREFFKRNNFSGKSFYFDLTKFDSSCLPSADICIIFKVLDIIENRANLTEKILTEISCSHFLISFSTKKLSGKPMNNPERQWFENILKKQGLKFKSFSSENEIFYLIKN